MLDHLGEKEAARIVMAALRHVAKEGPHTQDLGGAATTKEIVQTLMAALAH
jgi:tartrate dehydrogenase/decarboxylase/D-malate dehydrogenase